MSKKFNTKKIKSILCTLLAVVVVECGILLIPRAIDIKQESFVIVQNAELSIEATNSTYDDGSVMFYGYGYIIDSENNSELVFGLNFFDLSSINKEKLKNGKAVYAKHSRQLISFNSSE